MSGTFTITGTLMHHDTVTPHVNAPIWFSAAVYPDGGDNVIYTQGVQVITDADGSFDVELLTETDLYYTVVSQSDPKLFDTFTFLAPSAGSTVDIADIATTEPGAITPSILVQVQAAAAQAAADAAAVATATAGLNWQASHAYTAGQVTSAPDGTRIKRISSGTSRATFDATEQGLWLPVSTTVGTIEQIAQARAAFLARPTIFSGVKKQLDDGRSVAIAYLTDSTGNDPATEHIGLTCDRLHALYPNYRIEFQGYDNGSPNNYTGALRVVKYAGPTTERKVTFVGTANSGLYVSDSIVSQITGDLDVRAKVAATVWNNAAERTIVSKFGAAGARAWRLYLDGTNVNLQYTTDGTTLITAVSALTNFTLVNGQPTWLRVVFDVNNGAGGRDVKFYQSTDEGVTWVQKGATVTLAGTFSLFPGVGTNLELGSRQTAGAGNWVGDIYRVQVRSGIDGALVAPTLPDLWTPQTSSFDGVFSGDPIIQVWAGAASGWGLGNFISSGDLLIPAAGQSLQIISTSHNDGFIMDAPFWARWDQVLANVKLRAPAAAVGISNQNPETAPNTNDKIAAHRWRCRQLEVYAASRGAEFYDVTSAFLNAGVALSTLVNTSDGVHPTAAGSALWANTIQDRWHIAP